MSQVFSKIHIKVKSPDDWNKLSDLTFTYLNGQYSISADDRFSYEIENKRLSFVEDEGGCAPNDIREMTKKIVDVLGDSVIVFAVSSDYNVGDNSYLIYYFGDKIVHYDYYEGESGYEYDDDGELIEPDEEIDGDAMSALFYEIDINNISNCIEYCSESGVEFTEKEISVIRRFEIFNNEGESIIDFATPNGKDEISNNTLSCVSLMTISDGVLVEFKKAKGITQVAIPDNVTKIGEYAFDDCSNLTSITIPDSVTEIAEYAFSECSNLASITIPDSVIEIGESAFEGCSKLKSITIPDGVTEISAGAFAGCSNLKSITIPDSVNEINLSAFECCSSLKSIIIPDSVNKIGGYAFTECSNLLSITIPDSVVEIGKNVFGYCDDLTITAPAGSYAIEYAKENNIKYKEV